MISTLHQSVRSNNVASLSTFLSRGAEIDFRDEYGDTALHEACRRGTLESVEVLLNAGAGVSVANSMRRTPLHLAASRGDVRIAELLVSHGADPLARDRDGATALHAACAGDVAEEEAARSLLATPGTPRGSGMSHHGSTDRLVVNVSNGNNNNGNNNGGNAIGGNAAGSPGDGLAGMVAFLVAGSPGLVDAVDAMGRAPLYVAASRCRVRCVRSLVAKGADPLRKDRLGRTPLHAAAAARLAEAERILEMRSSDHHHKATTVLNAPGGVASPIRRARSSTLASHMSGETDAAGRNPSALEGEVDPAEVYLEVQGNSRCANAHRCLAALIDALPVTNSSVSVRDVGGKTPLHLAAAALDFESVSILVSVGAQVDAVDNTGVTPLMSLGHGPAGGAAQVTRERTALLLACHGARLDRRTLGGVSALGSILPTDDENPRFLRVFRRIEEAIAKGESVECRVEKGMFAGVYIGGRRAVTSMEGENPADVVFCPEPESDGADLVEAVATGDLAKVKEISRQLWGRRAAADGFELGSRGEWNGLLQAAAGCTKCAPEHRGVAVRAILDHFISIGAFAGYSDRALAGYGVPAPVPGDINGAGSSSAGATDENADNRPVVLTPLHVACFLDRPGVVLLLLQSSIRAMLPNGGVDPTLGVSIAGGGGGALVSVEARDPISMRTALEIAMDVGSAGCVEALVGFGADLPSARGRPGAVNTAPRPPPVATATATATTTATAKDTGKKSGGDDQGESRDGTSEGDEEDDEPPSAQLPQFGVPGPTVARPRGPQGRHISYDPTVDAVDVAAGAASAPQPQQQNRRMDPFMGAVGVTLPKRARFADAIAAARDADEYYTMLLAEGDDATELLAHAVTASALARPPSVAASSVDAVAGESIHASTVTTAAVSRPGSVFGIHAESGSAQLATNSPVAALRDVLGLLSGRYHRRACMALSIIEKHKGSAAKDGKGETTATDADAGKTVVFDESLADIQDIKDIAAESDAWLAWVSGASRGARLAAKDIEGVSSISVERGGNVTVRPAVQWFTGSVVESACAAASPAVVLAILVAGAPVEGIAAAVLRGLVDDDLHSHGHGHPHQSESGKSHHHANKDKNGSGNNDSENGDDGNDVDANDGARSESDAGSSRLSIGDEIRDERDAESIVMMLLRACVADEVAGGVAEEITSEHWHGPGLCAADACAPHCLATRDPSIVPWRLAIASHRSKRLRTILEKLLSAQHQGSADDATAAAAPGEGEVGAALYGLPPLLAACSAGRVGVVRTLIAWGADPRVTDARGLGVSHHASTGGLPTAVVAHITGAAPRAALLGAIRSTGDVDGGLLPDQGGGAPSSATATATGSGGGSVNTSAGVTSLRSLIAADPSLLASDGGTGTPLHAACATGRHETSVLLSAWPKGKKSNVPAAVKTPVASRASTPTTDGAAVSSSSQLPSAAPPATGSMAVVHRPLAIRDGRGATALHYATHDPEVAGLLLRHHASLGPVSSEEATAEKEDGKRSAKTLNPLHPLLKKDRLGLTPLHVAVRLGHIDFVDYVLGGGAWAAVMDRNTTTDDPRFAAFVSKVLAIKDHKGRTVLHIAAAHHSPELAMKIVRHNPPLGARDEGGRTPYVCARALGHTETASVLVSLHVAVVERDVAMMVEMTSSAHPSHRLGERDSLGRTPLMTAVREVISADRRRNRRARARAAAAAKAAAEVKSVAMPVNVIPTPSQYMSARPLPEPAVVAEAPEPGVTEDERDYETCMELVRVLLGAGANPTVADHAGDSPVHVAAGSGVPALLEAMLECAGVDFTPLADTAAATSQFRTRSASSSSEVANDGGGKVSALSPPRDQPRLGKVGLTSEPSSPRGGANDEGAAEDGGSPRPVPEMLAVVDAKGRTPLLVACAAARVDCVRVLLGAGARADVVDNDGNTALHLASTWPDWDKVVAAASSGPGGAGGGGIHSAPHAVNGLGLGLGLGSSSTRRRASSRGTDDGIGGGGGGGGFSSNGSGGGGRRGLLDGSGGSDAGGRDLMRELFSLLVSQGCPQTVLNEFGLTARGLAFRAGNTRAGLALHELWVPTRGEVREGGPAIESLVATLKVCTNRAGLDDLLAVLCHECPDPASTAADPLHSRSALHVAAGIPSLAPLAIDLLLDHCADLHAALASTDAADNTALHIAAAATRRGAAASSVSAVATLLSRGARSDPENDAFRTPLHNAVLGGNVAAAAMLCAAGADVDVRDAAGCTPLHYACGGGALVTAGGGGGGHSQQDQQPMAAQSNHSQIGMVGAGISSSGPAAAAASASGAAGSPGQLPPHALLSARVLIAHGARRDIASESGHTPFDLASDAGASELAALMGSLTRIVTMGPSHQQQQHYGGGSGGSSGGHRDGGGSSLSATIEAVSHMLRRGVHIDTPDEVGRTPLMLACRAASPDLDLIRFLLDRGASVQARDAQGLAAVHHCATAEAVSAVVANGRCDIDLRTAVSSGTGTATGPVGNDGGKSHGTGGGGGGSNAIGDDDGLKRMASRQRVDSGSSAGSEKSTAGSSSTASLESVSRQPRWGTWTKGWGCIPPLDGSVYSETAAGGSAAKSGGAVSGGGGGGGNGVNSKSNATVSFVDPGEAVRLAANELVRIAAIDDAEGDPAWLSLPGLAGNLAAVAGSTTAEESPDGMTALHIAVERGAFDLVIALLSLGADAAAIGPKGKGVLHMAVTSGGGAVAPGPVATPITTSSGVGISDLANTDGGGLNAASGPTASLLRTLETLIKHGADPDLRDANGRTAYDLAHDRDMARCACILANLPELIVASHDPGASPSLAQSMQQQTRALIRQGLDLNRPNSVGVMPLHTAVRCGDVELVEYLMSHGAETSGREAGGMTALHVAVEMESAEMCRLLLSKADAVAMVDDAGRNVLHVAAEMGSERVVAVLMAAVRGAQSGGARRPRGASRKTSAGDFGKGRPGSSARAYRTFSMVSASGEGESANSDVASEDGFSNDLAVPGHSGAAPPSRSMTSRLMQFQAPGSAGGPGGVGGSPSGAGGLSHLPPSAYIDPDAKDRQGRTALHCAAASGSAEIVRALLEAGARRDLPDKELLTPYQVAARHHHDDCVRLLATLHVAVRSGSIPELVLLMDHGVDPDARDPATGRTALGEAFQYNNIAMAELLLANGASVDATDSDKCSTLHVAVSHPDRLDWINLLLACGADIDSRDGDDRTPLMAACSAGQIETVKLLVEKGARYVAPAEGGGAEDGPMVGITDAGGYTVLHHAAASGSAECVRFFLERGLEKEAVSNDGTTPYMLAELSGHQGVAMELATLAFAVASGNRGQIARLIEAGADVNARLEAEPAKSETGGQGDNPSGAAAEASALARNHNPRHRILATSPGRTVLHEAASRANVRIVQSLVRDFGADVNAADTFGDRPLHVACANGRTAMVAALVELGADPCAVSNASETPLHAAARAAAASVARYLTSLDRDRLAKARQGAQASGTQAQSSQQQGSLASNSKQRKSSRPTGGKLTSKRTGGSLGSSGQSHSSSSSSSQQQQQQQQNTGAGASGSQTVVRVDAVDRRGFTPLHHAASHSNKDLVLVLLSNGSDPTLVDGEDRTPGMVATACGYMEIATILAKAEEETLSMRGARDPHAVALAAKRSGGGAEASPSRGAGASAGGGGGGGGPGAAASRDNSLGPGPSTLGAPAGRERSISSVHTSSSPKSERRGQRSMSSAVPRHHALSVSGPLGGPGGGSGSGGPIESPYDDAAMLLHPPHPEEFAAAVSRLAAANGLADPWGSAGAADRNATSSSLTPAGITINGSAAVDDTASGPLSRPGNGGWTLLHEACAVGSVPCVAACIETGVEIDSADVDGLTPAHIAAIGVVAAVEDPLDTHDGDADGNSGSNSTSTSNNVGPDGASEHRGVPISGSGSTATLGASSAHHDDHSTFGNKDAGDEHGASSTEAGEVVQRLIFAGAMATSRDSDGITPLHVACAARNIDAVREILRHTSSSSATVVVEERCAAGWRAVHYAAKGGSWPCVKAIVDAGGDYAARIAPKGISGPFAKGKGISALKGGTALHVASRAGSLACVEGLMGMGLDPLYPDTSGACSLHAAASEGHENIVRAILNHLREAQSHTNGNGIGNNGGGAGASGGGGRELLSSTDARGYTPLHAALANGHDSVAILLIQHATPADLAALTGPSAGGGGGGSSGATVPRGSATGFSPLHLACAAGCVRAAALLAAAVAGRAAGDLVAPRAPRLPPIGPAVLASAAGVEPVGGSDGSNGNDGAAVAFGSTAWRCAVDAGWGPGLGGVHVRGPYAERIAAQWDLGVAGGAPGAHDAASQGSSSGANTTAGVVRVIMAVCNGGVGELRALRSNVAYTGCDAEGWTALHEAALQGDTEAAQYLLDNGHAPSVHARDAAGQTPLFVAVAQRDAAMVRLLLSNGARLDVLDNLGTCPLELAVAIEAVRCVAIMLSTRAYASAAPRVRRDRGDDDPEEATARAGKGKRAATPGNSAPASRHLTARAIVPVDARSLPLVDSRGRPISISIATKRGAGAGGGGGGGSDEPMPATSSSTTKGSADRDGSSTHESASDGSGAGAVVVAADTSSNPAGATEQETSGAVSIECEPLARRDATGSLSRALCRACMIGSMGLVRTLLDEGADPNVLSQGIALQSGTVSSSSPPKADRQQAQAQAPAQVRCSIDDEALTPIMNAIRGPGRREHAERIVRHLVAAWDADVRAVDAAGRSALHHACAMGDGAITTYLLTAGAPADEPDAEGNTALHTAVLRCLRLPTVEDATRTMELLEASAGGLGLGLGTGPVTRNDPDGSASSSSKAAASVSTAQLANVLLRARANPNATNARGMTPLHISCLARDAHCVALLRVMGADPRARTLAGETPRALLMRHGACDSRLAVPLVVPVTRVALASASQRASLLRAIREDDLVQVQLLVSIGADLRAAPVSDHQRRQHRQKQAQMMYGKAAGPSSTSSAALAAGPGAVGDPMSSGMDDLSSVPGWTPLHEACQRGSPRAVALLLNAGAQPLARTREERWTPVHVAARRSDSSALEAMLSFISARVAAEGGSSSMTTSTAAKATTQASVAAEGTLLSKAVRCCDSQGRTPLHVAARAASVSNCALLLDHGAEVNKLSEHPDPALAQAPLHMAVASLSLETIRALVHKGALVNQKDGVGLTPLMHGAKRPSSLRVASSTSDASHAARAFLLEWGGDLFMQNAAGRTALHVAAAHGCARGVDAFVKGGALMDAVDAKMETALMLAIQGGHAECVKLLLDLGASCRAADGRLETALHKAARHGDAQFVTWLLDAGADKSAADVNGLTPYGLAFCTNHLECAELLYSDSTATDRVRQRQAITFKRALGADAVDLVLAIYDGDLELVAHLLRSNVAVDRGDNQGWRAIHEAVLRGDHEVVRLLVRNSGADVNVATVSGVTPLHLAAWLRNAETALLLVASGADVNAQTALGETPLHYAASCGSMDVASLLINNGALVDPNDAEGRSPLLLAVRHGDPRVVAMLLDAGADPSSEDAVGWSPAHEACSLGSGVCVGTLARFGADLSARALDGGAPLHVACASGNAGIVGLLLELGAEVNAAPENGSGGYLLGSTDYYAAHGAQQQERTPLCVACAAGASDCVARLIEAGASVRRPDADGWSPLHFASWSGVVECVDAIVARLRESGGSTRAGSPHSRAPSAAGVNNNGLNPNGANNGHNSTTIVIQPVPAAPGHRQPLPPAHVAGRKKNPRGKSFTPTRPGGSRKQGATAAEAVVFSEDLASLGLATRYPDDNVSSLSRRCRSARHDPVPGISATTWAPEGLTAMHLAASHGHATAIAVLAEAGCDPDAVSASGHTALHLAAAHGRLACIPVLVLIARARIDLVDSRGATALHIAVSRGHVHCAQALVNLGADVDVVDGYAMTPLDRAVLASSQDASTVLLSGGARREYKSFPLLPHAVPRSEGGAPRIRRWGVGGTVGRGDYARLFVDEPEEDISVPVSNFTTRYSAAAK